MFTKLPRVFFACALICALAQVPAAAVSERSLERRGDEVRERLDRTRDDLADTQAEQRRTEGTLRDLDAQQTVLADELAKLTAQLEAAEQELQIAETALRHTRAEIDELEYVLDQNELDLAYRREQLVERARAAYMYGDVDMVGTVFNMESANDLATSMQYMRTLIGDDQQSLERMEGLERESEALLERLDELKVIQDEARAERAERRDEVAELVDARRQLEAQLQAQVDQHRQLLDQLNADAGRYKAAIDELEAQGAAVERRLAAVAAQESSGGGGGSAAVTPQSRSGFQWPVAGPITSGYGYRTHPVLGYRRLHAGIDFGAASGTPIVAANSGVVVTAGWLGGYGNAVIISHGGGVATLYAHQSRLAVGAGTRVSRGQVIGYVGSTGMSTGPHLHFEVRLNGSTVDPTWYF